MFPLAEKIPFYSRDGEIEVFEACHNVKLPLLLKGPTGCGKSQLVEFMARKLSKPLIKVACNEDTNAADLLGRFLLRGGETVWQDGPITRAIKEGAILYLDEFAEAREDVIVAIHPLTDHRREVYLDKINRVERATQDFMLVASYNPGYQKGLKELKPSTKQRFVILAMNYLPEAKEQQLICDLTGVGEKVASLLVKVATKIREKNDLILKETVSTRLLLNSAKLIKTGLGMRRACHFSIAEVLSDDRQVVQALSDFIDLYV